MITAARPCVILLVAAATAFSLPVSSRADEADDQYAVAVGHYQRGQWKLAFEEFQKFRQAFPQDHRQALSAFCLGESLTQLGRFDEAREYFRDYLAREPAGAYAKDSLLRLGQCAFLAGKLAAAKPDLERFLKEYPSDRWNETALNYLGEIALARNDAVAADGAYRDALKRFPHGRLEDSLRVGLARALEMQGQRDEAERLYLTVAKKASSSQADAAQFHLGAMRFEAGRHAEAVEAFAAFETRFVRSAWRPNAQLGRGLALLKLNQPAEAAKQFDAVLATPGAAEALVQRALRGKVQASLQRKDYEALDRQAAEFEKRFANGRLGDDVRRLVARSLIERKQYARAATLLESLVARPAGLQDHESRYLLAVSYEAMSRHAEALAAIVAVVGGATGDLKSDAQIEHGVILLALKRYADAIGPLEVFLASKPSGESEAKALAALAICRARAGQLDRAKRTYAELLAKHGKSPLIASTTEQLAEAAYQANDAVWSAELANRLAASHPSAEYQLKGKLNLGWSQYKAGKLAEAADTFAAVLKQSPPVAMEVEAALIRGHILEQLDRGRAALAMYELVIQKHPSSPQYAEALLAAARLQNGLKHWSEAIALCDRLSQEHPGVVDADGVLYERAWALLGLGKTEEANRAFETLHKEYPKSRYWADATCRMAQRAFDARDYDRATRLIGALPEKTEPEIRKCVLYLRGQMAMARRDWNGVRESFGELVREFPTANRRLAAEAGIAEADYQQDDLIPADARLDRLADEIKGQHEPWMGLIQLRRAQILAKRGQWSEAAAIAEKIEKDYPRFEQQHDADCLLGQCLAMQANFEGARRAYQKAIHSASGAKSETAARAQWLIGESFYHQKKYQAALREYLKVEILYAYPSWQAAALFEAAKCHEQLGEKKEAAELYRRIVKTYPKSPLATEAGKRLGRTP